MANLILNAIRVPLYIKNPDLKDKAVNVAIQKFEEKNPKGEEKESEIIIRDNKRLRSLTKVKVLKRIEDSLKSYYFIRNDSTKKGNYEIIATEEGVRYRTDDKRYPTRLLESKLPQKLRQKIIFESNLFHFFYNFK